MDHPAPDPMVVLATARLFLAAQSSGSYYREAEHEPSGRIVGEIENSNQFGLWFALFLPILILMVLSPAYILVTLSPCVSIDGRIAFVKVTEAIIRVKMGHSVKVLYI